MIKVALLTISTRAAAGVYPDHSGPLLAQIIADKTDWHLFDQTICSDNTEQIVGHLLRWSNHPVQLILTTGGTGFSPTDITPEATRFIIERETPGISEALRQESRKITQHAMLSRAISGIRGETLIINLPGNPKAVREHIAILLPVLPHALEILGNHPQSEQSHRKV